MKNLIVTTTYENMTDDDLKNYCKFLTQNPLLVLHNIPENLAKNLKASFSTPKGAGRGKATTHYEIVDSE